MNLRKTQGCLQPQFLVLAGPSCHTLDHYCLVISVDLGGCNIEKRLRLSRADQGPDCLFSRGPS
ncbi:MAG: N-acetylneuraminate synthase family protein [Pirellulales bacterium]